MNHGFRGQLKPTERSLSLKQQLQARKQWLNDKHEAKAVSDDKDVNGLF